METGEIWCVCSSWSSSRLIRRRGSVENVLQLQIQQHPRIRKKCCRWDIMPSLFWLYQTNFILSSHFQALVCSRSLPSRQHLPWLCNQCQSHIRQIMQKLFGDCFGFVFNSNFKSTSHQSFDLDRGKTVNIRYTLRYFDIDWHLMTFTTFAYAKCSPVSPRLSLSVLQAWTFLYHNFLLILFRCIGHGHKKASYLNVQ